MAVDWETEQELKEAKAEIARHHRDFDRISDIVEQVLRDHTGSKDMIRARYWGALKEIRGIVG